MSAGACCGGGPARTGGPACSDAGEVESLARRGRPRHPGAGEFVIESALTEITSDRTCYRGLDITALAARYELEDAAWLLWTGELTAATAAPGGPLRPRCGRAGRHRLRCPPGTLPLERFGVIVPALAAAIRCACSLTRPP